MFYVLTPAHSFASFCDDDAVTGCWTGDDASDSDIAENCHAMGTPQVPTSDLLLPSFEREKGEKMKLVSTCITVKSQNTQLNLNLLNPPKSTRQL